MSIREEDLQQNTGMLNLQEALRLGGAVVTEVWSFSAKDWVSSVHAADIDGDGDIEVLIGSRHYRLYALTKLGDLKWEKRLPCEWIGCIVGIDDSVAVNDTRVVAGSRDNTIYGFDAEGNILWHYDAAMVVRQVAVCDINQDGQTEVVFGSEDRSISALACADGTLLWRYPTSAWVRAVCVDDVDQDGVIEILGGSGDNYLYAINAAGQLKWRHNAESKIYALTSADIDGDGQPEILVSTDAKDLYALNSRHQKKWKVELENRVLSIFVMDLNNDGRMEILAGSEDKHLYVFSDQGVLLWKHNVGACIFSVYGVDVDRDGVQEIFLGAEDGCVHVLRIELVGNELDKILSCYKQLGSPDLADLNLTPTQLTLLSDLVGENSSRSYTLQDLNAADPQHDRLATLDVLLRLEQQHVQQHWCRSVGYIRSVALGDITGDKCLEIVIGTSQGNVRALDVTGTVRWTYPLSDRVRAVQVGDIDNDGQMEVVVGSIDGRVCILDSTGAQVKWESKLGDWVTSISIVPSEIPGLLDLVMGTEEHRIHVFDWRFTPAVEPFFTPQGLYVVLADDFNLDGTPEIIAGTVDNHVYAYTKNGHMLWDYQTRDRVRALMVLDIDGDQHKEVIVGSEDRSVHVVDDAGHLKWRYYASHRVLDVWAADIDQDGRVEIFLGCGDGYLYVLSAEGDLIWQYKVNDRIRVVRVIDLNLDGVNEVVIGTEDQLYLLSILDAKQLTRQISSFWQDLVREQTLAVALKRFLQHGNPLFRVFALRTLASRPDALGQYPTQISALLNDPALTVRCELARAIPALYRYYPEQVRRCFDLLAGDPMREVRLAFVDSLAELITLNHELTFAYFERFTRSVDMWVRRTMVRKLYDMVGVFPQQVFRLLVIAAHDEKQWVIQETARTLAHYFDRHTDNLIEGARALIKRGEIGPEVYRLIEYRATQPIVRNVFRVMIDLFYELDEKNMQERLRKAVRAFEDTRHIPYGPEIWQFYNELSQLASMRNIDEIALYKYTLDESPADNWIHFESTLHFFQQIVPISNALSTYLRREGLGDRLASLLEASKAIDIVVSEIKDNLGAELEPQQFSDLYILRLLLRHWRTIVSSEMSRLVGRANLRVELQTRTVPYEEYVGVWLQITNDGNSPADTVMVRLQESQDFSLISENNVSLDLVPSRDAVQVEFTIRVKQAAPRLNFELTYNDAEGKSKVHRFADRLELQAWTREFVFISNPYSVGIPIKDREMFYGRQEDLAILRTDLTNTQVNVALVLYGQRRSGKTSLLNQLVNTEILAPHIPVYIDMQNEALGITEGKFLRNLAHYIYKALKKREMIIAPPPVLQSFERDSTFTMNDFLDEVEGSLHGRKLILLIDEFEVLEQKVNDHALPQEIFGYLRGLMQHRRLMSFLFSGTHTIKQLTAAYWSVFFNIARQYPLSRLGGDAARQLIEKPVEGVLEYDPFSILKIRHLTADQPYLIQLICRALVDHCNLQQKNYVTINDVNSVLDEVLATGEGHFTWMWEQTAQQERIILSILAYKGGEDCALVSYPEIREIYASYGLPYDHKLVLQALEDLRQKEFIESRSDNTRFRILLGLSQRWLHNNKKLRRVMLEENLLM